VPLPVTEYPLPEELELEFWEGIVGDGTLVVCWVVVFARVGRELRGWAGEAFISADWEQRTSKRRWG
jgi:hypothetical protein